MCVVSQDGGRWPASGAKKNVCEWVVSHDIVRAKVSYEQLVCNFILQAGIEPATYG